MRGQVNSSVSVESLGEAPFLVVTVRVAVDDCRRGIADGGDSLDHLEQLGEEPFEQPLFDLVGLVRNGINHLADGVILVVNTGRDTRAEGGHAVDRRVWVHEQGHVNQFARGGGVDVIPAVTAVVR